jgi:nucleoside-diphosphate-sugar epimerase
LQRATGWQPEVAFETLLEDLMKYWRETLARTSETP